MLTNSNCLPPSPLHATHQSAPRCTRSLRSPRIPISSSSKSPFPPPFGLSAVAEQMRHDGLFHTSFGPPAYVAPEVLSRREYFDIGLPVIQKAGVAHKIDIREGPAGPILDELIAGEGAGFDFAFVDADKPSYARYHEQLLRLVRVGGVLAYDNTLWGGTVAMPDDTPLTDHDLQIRDSMRALNVEIAADARVEAIQLPIADGVTLCRRVA